LIRTEIRQEFRQWSSVWCFNYAPAAAIRRSIGHFVLVLPTSCFMKQRG